MGCFKADIIKSSVQGKELYVYLENEYFQGYSILRKVKNDFSCLVDEIKPIFGLPKMGTQTIKIGSFLYLMIRPSLEKGVIISDRKLSLFSNNKNVVNNSKFRKKVQDAFIFRDLLLLKPNNQNTIKIRKINGQYIPLCYEVNDTSLTENYKTLNRTIIDTWFKKMELDSVTKRLICYREGEDVSKILFYYREKLEEIILHVNKSYLSYINTIISRISQYLD